MKARLKALRRIESERGGKFETPVAIVLVIALVALGFLATRDAGGYSQEQMAVDLGGRFWAVVSILALISLNGCFVAAEAALELLKPHHGLLARESDERRGLILDRLYRDRLRLAGACTFGSQTARVAIYLIGLVPALALSTDIRRPLNLASDPAAIIVAAAIVWIPITLLNVVLGELVPKSYAVMHPGKVAYSLYRFIETLGFLFSWPASLVARLASLVTVRFGGQASLLGVSSSEAEILNLVASAEAEGEIEEEEKNLLESVFEFGDKVAREVMTPRVDLDALPVTSTSAEVIAVIESSGHSRIPLYQGTDDQIVGIVHAKDLLRAAQDGKTVRPRTLMRKPLFVPENKSLRDLLAEMRQNKTQMAVVQDEFGGTSGVVTVEDILEELVGEIQDEYDVEEEPIKHTADGLIVNAMAAVDDVAEELGIEIESEEFDTIGGYVFGLFGRQPKKGESIEAAGCRFTVTETDGRRIQNLAIVRAAVDQH